MKCALLILVVSLDAFVASVAYGSKGIKIPFKSTIIVNLISSVFLTISIVLASQFKKVLPSNIASTISFLILLSMGIFYLFESMTKSHFKAKSNINKEIEFKMSNLRFMINIYIDETTADRDYSKVLDSKESVYLGTALSLDSLAIGFGSGLSDINYVYLVIFSLFVGLLAVRSGFYIGRQLSQNKKINLSWLAGIILIALAITRLF